MSANLSLSLQVFAAPPAALAEGARPLARQVWRGGATDLATRRMMPDPPRWLALTDCAAGSAAAAAATGAAVLAWELDQLLPGGQVSPAGAGGVILVAMDIDPAVEDEFNDFYNTEHIPLFLLVPGVIAGRRFRAVRGGPRYIALYHVETTAVYATPAWMAVNQTPWILRMRRFQRNRTYFMFDTFVGGV